MLAWILKTKPVILGSEGSTVRVSVGARAREGADADEALEQLAHAELFTAEPKKTGASSPRR